MQIRNESEKTVREKSVAIKSAIALLYNIYI